ncbi:hypothetical protein NC653_014164 [Populus alba x Populus x berolinensis]|uniref:Uncharacterized protein n=1 Tax=Populus alba x Populus x berolinensis TaxID=444605 RepID=A0AAD6QW85_9ROSI|nr:hypothetical protein NC653_014164 [Populus alba x Populus x berolinensis]
MAIRASRKEDQPSIRQESRWKYSTIVT